MSKLTMRREFCGATRFVHPDLAGRGECPVLLVGEDNPYSADPLYALWPDPPHAAGGRLARILGADEWLHKATWRTNLCERGRWSAPHARARAEELAAAVIREPAAPWRLIVALGAKVAGAFALCAPNLAPFSFQRTPLPGGDAFTIACIPHPSGRNRVWNAPGAAAQARALVRALAREWYDEPAEGREHDEH